MVLSENEKDNSALVRTWILEYACKNKMKAVISELLKQNPTVLNLKCADCGNSSEPPVNPTYLVHFLFSELFENISSILQKPMTLDVMYTIDSEILAICADTLECLYIQDHFTEFKSFYKLHGALKLLSLILRVVRGEPNDVVTKHLDALFPSCTQERLECCATQFGLSEKLAMTHQKREKEARLFILQLLIKEGKRQEYVLKRMLPEIKAFLECIQSTLPEAIKTAIAPKMPETFIDKIIAQGANISHSYSDPAVKVLLEFVQPNFKEEDLISAIRILDPANEIVPVLPVIESHQNTVPVVEKAREKELSLEDDDSDISIVGFYCSQKPDNNKKAQNAATSESNMHKARSGPRGGEENVSKLFPSKRKPSERSSIADTLSPAPKCKKQRSLPNFFDWSPVQRCSVILYFTKDYSCDDGEFALFT